MWARILGIAVGIWLMVGPAILGYSGIAAGMSDRIAGPMLLGASFAALWPVLRSLRWIELPVGIWIFVSPLFLGYGRVLPVGIHVATGFVLVVFAFLGGKTGESFGGGWASVAPFIKRQVGEEL